MMTHEVPSLLLQIGILKDAGKIEELKKYFIDHLGEYQKSVKHILGIRFLLSHVDHTTLFLIKELNPKWLKNLLGFKNPSCIADCLLTLPLAHWHFYLDHVYKKAAQFRINIIWGSSSIIRDFILRFNEKQCETFFAYLGQDWLQYFFSEPQKLARILRQTSVESSTVLLRRLNSDDQWIERIFNNKENLGYILNKITYLQPMDRYIAPVKIAFGQWQMLLNYFTTDWRETLIANDYALKLLLENLSSSKQWPKQPINSGIFLEFIAELGQYSKAINLISKINENLIHEIMLEGQSFKKAFGDVAQQENKPYFQLRLFAMACTYHAELMQHPPRLAITFVGFSYQAKLAGANSLIQSMLKDEKPDENIAQMSRELGQLVALYRSGSGLALECSDVAQMKSGF